MKYLILLLLTSCTASRAVTSSTNFELQNTDTWERIPNSIKVSLPGVSYGDLTFKHASTDTVVIFSSVHPLDGVTAQDLLSSLKTMISSIPDTEVSYTDIRSTPEIRGASEISMMVESTTIRIIILVNKKYVHVIHVFSKQRSGQDASSALLKTFKVE